MLFSLQRIDQRPQRFGRIGHHLVVRRTENGCVGIGVHRYHRLRSGDARQMLDSAGNTAGDQQPGRYGGAGLADGWEAAVLGNTVMLLIQIKRATDERSARAMEAEKPELLDGIAAYVEENYRRRITIGELARLFYVSASTVSHLFKQKLGVSFYRYVTQRRLIAAKTLIESGIRLEDVAIQTGFRDYSGFYRAFKQEYGISPRQYRSLQEEGK